MKKLKKWDYNNQVPENKVNIKDYMRVIASHPLLTSLDAFSSSPQLWLPQLKHPLP